MSTLKLFWQAHKWTGIVLALVFVVIAATGFLLLIKKDYAWIQPPTERGADGEPADWIGVDAVIERALAHVAAWEAETGRDIPFDSFEDVDRIDFRPGKNVHKVRSNEGWWEVQVDATSGAILSGPTRRVSDIIEQIHDGSLAGDFVHGWVMPLVSVALAFLTFSGLWIWIAPMVKRRRRRRLAKAHGGRVPPKRAAQPRP